METCGSEGANSSCRYIKRKPDGKQMQGIKIGEELIGDRLTAFVTPINGFPVDIPSVQ